MNAFAYIHRQMHEQVLRPASYIEHLTKDIFLWDTPHVLIIPYFNKENVYAGVEPACSLFSAFTDTRKSEKQR